jgi:hypothetical protein
MTIMPALQQQKVLIVSALVVVVIIFFGSWYVKNQNTSFGTGTTIPTTATTDPTDAPVGNLIVLIQSSKTPGSPSITYTLKVAPTDYLLQSVGLGLVVDGGVVTSSQQQSNFTTSSELNTTGWMAATNTAITSEDDRSTLQVSFINLKPEGGVVSEPLVLGTFTVEPTSGTTPQFTVDQSVSSAFTKDGSPMIVNLVIEPTTTE